MIFHKLSNLFALITGTEQDVDKLYEMAEIDAELEPVEAKGQQTMLKLIPGELKFE